MIILRSNKFWLSVLGLLNDHLSNAKSPRRCVQSIQSYTTLFGICSLQIPSVLFILEHKDDVGKVSDALYSLLNAFNCAVKLSFFIFNKNNLNKFLYDLKEIVHES